MAGIAVARLATERKQWRKNHPFGFVARPAKNADGSLNLMLWDCVIPGQKGTPWEGGLYKLKMKFDNHYPIRPPQCRFVDKMFHPNIFESGYVCLSILEEEEDWHAGMTIKDILVGIQWLLNDPNTANPTNLRASHLFKYNPELYAEKIRELAREMAPKE